MIRWMVMGGVLGSSVCGCSTGDVDAFRRAALLPGANAAGQTELPTPVVTDSLVLGAVRGRDHMTLTLRKDMTGAQVIQQYGLTMIGDAAEVIERETGGDLDRSLREGQKLSYRLTLKGKP